MNELKDHIHEITDVLDADDYFRLLDLVATYDYGDKEPIDSECFYNLTGDRHQIKIEPSEGELFDLVHKVFSLNLPAIREYYQNFLPEGDIYDKYSGYWLCRYSDGGHLSRHTDTDADAASVTASFNINDNYEGGELVFWDNHKLETKRNTLHIYPSNFLYPHRVDPVTRGIRYSIVVWFAYWRGEDWRFKW